MIGNRTNIVAFSTGYYAITIYCDAAAKFVICGTIRGCHFLLLRPRRSAASVNVRRAIVIGHGTANNRLARDRHAITELVKCRPIGRGQFLLLCPNRSTPTKNISRTTCTIVRMCSDDHCLTVDGNAPAKLVARKTVAGSQFLLLCPNGAVSRENVGYSTRAICPERTNDRGVATNANADAELIVQRTVGGHELCLLSPLRIAKIDERRALVDRWAIIQICTNDRGASIESDAPAEIIIRDRVGSGEFGTSKPQTRTPRKGVGRAEIIIIMERTRDEMIAIDRDTKA